MNSFSCASLIILLREKLTFCVQEQHMLIELDGLKNYVFEEICTMRNNYSQIQLHKQNTLCAVDGHLCCLSHFITVISGDTNVIRRSGSNVLQLAVDKSLKAYQEGMDGGQQEQPVHRMWI